MTNQAPQPGFPDFSNISPADFETHNQRLLRREFAEAEARNHSELATFDPTDQHAEAVLELGTTFPEYEDVEPRVTQAHRAAMLRSLGLQYEPLEEGDDRRLFQCVYREGEVRQVRFVEREDGVQVPVYTCLGSTEAGNPVERLVLMSNQKAAEYVNTLEANIDEQRLNSRLERDFGLTPDFLEQAGLSLEDKRAMIAAHDEIKAIQIAAPDSAALDQVRTQMVKKMMPSTQLLAMLRINPVPEAQQAYEEAMNTLLNNPDYDQRTIREFQANEELLRLSALNERLQKRVKMAKIGSVALAGATAVIMGSTGAAAGTIAEATQTGEITTMGPVIGAALGAVAGLAFGGEYINDVRRGAKRVKQFETNPDVDTSQLRTQLEDEGRLAANYLRFLRGQA